MPGDTQSFGVGINDRGEVIGISLQGSFGQHHAFVWEAGRLTALTPPAGHTGSTPLSINERGEILFRCAEPGEVSYFLWQCGHTIELDAALGNVGIVNGLNNHGQFIGRGIDAQGFYAALWSLWGHTK